MFSSILIACPFLYLFNVSFFNPRNSFFISNFSSMTELIGCFSYSTISSSNSSNASFVLISFLMKKKKNKKKRLLNGGECHLIYIKQTFYPVSLFLNENLLHFLGLFGLLHAQQRPLAQQWPLAQQQSLSEYCSFPPSYFCHGC